MDMDIQYCMGVDMLHEHAVMNGHGHIACMYMEMLHGYGHVPWIRKYCIGMDMLHGPEHAALIWTCCMDMDRLHGHGHVL
jgi:hypothetical protein